MTKTKKDNKNTPIIHEQSAKAALVAKQIDQQPADTNFDLHSQIIDKFFESVKTMFEIVSKSKLMRDGASVQLTQVELFEQFALLSLNEAHFLLKILKDSQINNLDDNAIAILQENFKKLKNKQNELTQCFQEIDRVDIGAQFFVRVGQRFQGRFVLDHLISSELRKEDIIGALPKITAFLPKAILPSEEEFFFFGFLVVYVLACEFSENRWKHCNGYSSHFLDDKVSVQAVYQELVEIKANRGIKENEMTIRSIFKNYHKVLFFFATTFGLKAEFYRALITLKADISSCLREGYSFQKYEADLSLIKQKPLETNWECFAFTALQGTSSLLGEERNGLGK